MAMRQPVKKSNRKKAILLRKSRAITEDEKALLSHKLTLTKLAENNEWDYDLYGGIVSGFDEKEHMKEFLDNIDKYDGALVMDIDRLGRDDEELAHLKKLFHMRDVEVITPQRTYNFDNESDKMTYSFEALLANMEGERIKKRLKRGIVDGFRQGKYTIAEVPTGYRRNPETKKLEIDKDEADIVRKIFTLSSEGFGATYIARMLTDLGYRSSPKAKVFTHSLVRKIQKQKIYAGIATLTVRNERGEIAEIIEQEVPKIISLDLYLKVQDEIYRRNNNKANTRGYVKSMLSGLLRCKHCGKRMMINKMRNGSLVLNPCDKVYLDGSKCKNSGVKLEILEQWVMDELWDFRDVLREQLAVTEVETIDDLNKGYQEEINIITKNIEEIQKQKNDLEDKVVYQGFAISMERYNTIQAGRDAEIESMKLKIKALRIKMTETAESNNKDTIEHWIKVIEEFRKYDLPKQNESLKYFIDYIEYDRQVPADIPVWQRSAKATLDNYLPSIHIHWRKN